MIDVRFLSSHTRKRCQGSADLKTFDNLAGILRSNGLGSDVDALPSMRLIKQ